MSMMMPPMMNGLHVISEQPSSEQRRNRRHHDRHRKMTGLRHRTEAGDDSRDLRAVQPHDGKNRPELNHDGENGIFVPDHLSDDQQMRR
jgi:hypothetical protein